VEPTDPFEPEAILPSGPFAGHRLDVSRFRSVRLLSSEAAPPYGLANGEQLLANVLHDQRWHLARMPTGPVAEVIAHVEEVPHSFPGAHAQIRFRLKPDHELRLLDSPDVALNDLVYSVEGNFAPGTSSAATGGIEQSGVDYMLMSLSEKVRAMSVEGRLHRVRQYRLDVTEEQKQEIFQRALEMATQAESQRMFNLLRRNCTTEAIAVLDGALHYPTWRRVLTRLTYSGLPEAMHLYLKERGLLGPDSRLQDLADELEAVEGSS
jgi:hypothetical protein